MFTCLRPDGFGASSCLRLCLSDDGAYGATRRHGRSADAALLDMSSWDPKVHTVWSEVGLNQWQSLISKHPNFAAYFAVPAT